MSTSRLRDRMLRVMGQIDLSPCSGCDACATRCATGVQMSREEYRAVKEYVGHPANRVTVEAAAAQAKALDMGDGLVVQWCRFRDNVAGGCAVYAVRPLVCRLLGHVEWLPCPIERIERRADTGDALDLMAAYADEERHTWEEWEETER